MLTLQTVADVAVTGIASVLAAWISAEVGNLKRRIKALEEK